MRRRVVTSVLTLAGLLLPLVSAAQSGWPVQLIPSGCLGAQRAAGECGLPQMLQVAVNLARLMLGLLGSITLIVFVYGGVVWLTAAGNAQRVERGKQVFEGALVGLVIVLAAWVIVNFVLAALTGTPLGQNVELFRSQQPGQGGTGQPPFQIPGQ